MRTKAIWLLVGPLLSLGCAGVTIGGAERSYRFQTLKGEVIVLDLQNMVLAGPSIKIPLHDCSDRNAICVYGSGVRIAMPRRCGADFSLVKFGRSVPGIVIQGVDPHTGNVAFLDRSRRFAYGYGTARGLTDITLLSVDEPEISDMTFPIDRIAYSQERTPNFPCR